jgi:hypothetical protein
MYIQLDFFIASTCPRFSILHNRLQVDKILTFQVNKGLKIFIYCQVVHIYIVITYQPLK